MFSIVIKNSLKLSDFDKLYAELYGHIGAKRKISLVLPKTLNKNFFAITSSLIQFVATWVRMAIPDSLVLELADDADQIEKMYGEEFFFPILSLVWNDVPIINNRKQNLRPILRNYQNDYILKMRRLEALKGEKMMLVNLDHFDKNVGILPYFEINNQFSTNESILSETLKGPILGEVLKLNSESRRDFLGPFGDISGIVYELMKNTFEWAKEDEYGVPISPNIRGLYVKFYKRSRTRILEDYKEDKSIIEYFSNTEVIRNNHLDQIYFIELSVFDGGSGFIRKFKDPDKSELSDIDIIKKCLIKNQTSSQGIFKNDKGIGLDRILNILDNKGFLRIRTDKYCLYRNMITSPYQSLERAKYKEINLFDWKNRSATKFSTLNACSGSSISILYPLSQGF